MKDSCLIIEKTDVMFRIKQNSNDMNDTALWLTIITVQNTYHLHEYIFY